MANLAWLTTSFEDVSSAKLWPRAWSSSPIRPTAEACEVPPTAAMPITDLAQEGEAVVSATTAVHSHANLLDLQHRAAADVALILQQRFCKLLLLKSLVRVEVSLLTTAFDAEGLQLLCNQV